MHYTYTFDLTYILWWSQIRTDWGTKIASSLDLYWLLTGMVMLRICTINFNFIFFFGGRGDYWFLKSFQNSRITKIEYFSSTMAYKTNIFRKNLSFLILTYLLTSCSRVLLGKLTGLQLVKKFHAFYETRSFITAFTSARHLSLSWASSIQSVPPHPTS
jgi:hypothetical protein